MKKIEGLSERECEIMDLVLEGYAPSGIANKLFITKGCVNSHMIHVYRKLEIYREKGKDIKILAIRKYLEYKRSKENAMQL